MKRYLFFLSFLACFLVGTMAFGDDLSPSVSLRNVGHVLAWSGAGHGYVVDEVLIKYRSWVGPNEQKRHVRSIDGQSLGSYEELRVQRVRLPAGQSVEQALDRLRTQDVVEEAEPNYLRSISIVPDHTNFVQLWAFQNTGQTVNGVTGTSGADIGMTSAWNISTGSRGVVVAVIDTGINYNHPDLAANIWQNPGVSCTAKANLDNSGFVGDCRGWNFVDNNNDPLDLNGHGTHVAGIMGAAGANVWGLVGVNWTLSIMPLRVLDATGYGTTADVIAAINYATEMKAQIINASFGGSDASQLEQEAIEAFVASGGLFVAAAGNGASDNDSSPFYPAAYQINGLIAVAATDSSDALASWSNYGSGSVLVAAPGVNILSTYIPPRTTVWQDLFSGPLAWTTGGINDSWGIESSSLSSDSTGGNYLPGTNSWAESPVISLASRVGCQLNYGLTLDTAQDSDFLYAEVSADGVTWNTESTWTGTIDSQQWVTSDVSAYDGQNLYLRFHLVTSPTSPGRDGAHIADVSVSCFSPTDNGQDYAFLSGTSMAAPMVSGLAALIKAVTPSLTNLEIGQIIATSVDEKSGLAGKVASGGRINANRAVNMAALGTPSLSAQAAGNGVNLAWSTSSGLVTNYVVQRASAAAGPYSTIANVASSQTSYGDTGITGSSTYYYQVLAANDVAQSLPSNDVAVDASGSGGGGGGGGGGGCFIATAAYGSYLAPEVQGLRLFRDRYLMRCPEGRLFVALYYHYSPALAEIIRKREVLRSLTRFALTPVVYGVTHPWYSATIILLCPFAVFVTLYLPRRGRRKEV